MCGLRVSTKPLSGTWHPAQLMRPASPRMPSVALEPSLSPSSRRPEKDGSKNSRCPNARAVGSSATRLPHYIGPLYPAAAILAASYWTRCLTDPATPGIRASFHTLMGLGFQPTEYVDVSAVIDTKTAMLEAHQSQLTWLRDHDGVDVVEQMRTVSRFRGLQCGVEYAEGFVPCLTWLRPTTSRLLP